ncbi:peptidylprolyl isomerase [Convivina praedatoris]|uniref:Foldase protein PrsA n=1 Tax=Convivina praedatoris TaxID=2880963 RepID=A0ABN8H748_9LACO|nr:peptidylprolyl isomerase [Convivina sp. LMG 32447]CAH1849931.1 Foldase protein PrsA [Convivina sp. LMG 32447]CAH1849935.1 Foldase protein PrsA [Convivina sp. LMG 32447]CAH1851310.1 Foldase protein PrsA [Convivina sp. LMG 32447]
MRRKIVWGLLIVIFLGGLVYLFFNSSKTVMTSTAGKITEKEYYDDVKKSAAGQQEFANMVINKVLNKEYGKDVSKSDSDKAFDTQKAQYGSQFKEVLAQNNMTEEQFKESIRNKMIMTYAVKANYKISQKQLDEAYSNYQPETTISLITAKNQDDAQAAIDDINAGDSWASVYKKYSSENKNASATGQLPAFDSTNTSVDSEIRKAAFNMSGVGAISDSPVKGTSGNYHVIKIDKVSDKPAQSKVEKKLKDKIATDFLNDSKNQTEIQKIIGSILRKDDVSVKDTDLKNALSGYMTSGVTANSSSSK